MDAAELRVFEAVARHGGMGRAAEELNTVQSNVTARIRNLEDDLGTPLFRRHARGVVLTAAGQRLLPYATKLAALLKEARQAAREDGNPAGPLVIGSLETTTAMRLSTVLSRFAETYPAVDLTLRTGTTCELVEQVLDQQMEGAFVCGPVAHADLVTERFFVEELVLLTPPSIMSVDALTSRRDLRIVVLRRGCSYRQRLEDVLARRGAVTPRLLEFGTLEAVCACVAGGLGVTLLPRTLLDAVPSGRRLSAHTLEPAEAMVETLFVRRADGYLSSALAAFLAAVRSPEPSLQVAAE